MKILAIRGNNLASLAGEFEVHFSREPLASSNLFAICGPTGSGKSTLLDALCLALYDKTPRLNRDRANSVDLPDVGKETITPRDPRYLLRRGTGNGYAEVDFVGNDGVEYRARWSVQRAHRKADRPLQDTKMELKTLADEQPISGKKSEVLEEIRKRLGLEFDQFTRAVLLAQNEFAAFLKADNDARGTLLQTLTGLDIYEKISVRAHQRAKAEQQVLDDLNAQLKGHQTLTAEERAELEQKFSTAKAETSALEQRKAELDQQSRWHESWGTLKQAEQQAREALRAAVFIQESAAPRHAYFGRVESVQDARPLAADVERTTGEIGTNRRAASDAEDRLAETQRDRRQAEDALAQTSQAVADAEQAKTAANPDLDKAKALDAEIALLVPNHQAAAKARDDAREAEARAQSNLADKQSEREQTTQRLQATQNWLAAHERLRPLAENWPRWDTLLDQAANLQNDSRESERTIADNRQDATQQRQARDQAKAMFAKAETALQAAEIELQRTAQTLAEFDLEALAGRRSTLESRRDQIAHAEKLWKVLADSLDRQRELDGEARMLREQLAKAEAELTRIVAAKPTATARLEQAEKSLKTAEVACAERVETLRENLEAGSPCPVCGATEHPYALGDAPSRALLAGLKTEVGACRKELDDLVAREATHKANFAGGRQRLADLAKERESLAGAIRRDTDAWNAHPVAAEAATIESADRLASWFTARNQSAQEQLDAIKRQETDQRQANKARDEAQKARDNAQRQHSAARDALTAAQAELDKTAQALQAAIARQEETTQQLNQRLDALDAAFAGQSWRPAWQADPAAFHREQGKQAAQWISQSKTVERLQADLGTLGTEINNLTATATEKTAHLRRASEAFETADHALREKRQQRQALFDGRPITEVETELAKAIEDTKLKHQQQTLARQKAAEAQASAEAVLGQAKQALAASQQAADRASATLGVWIAKFNTDHPDEALDHPQLGALLAHDSAWLTRQREELRQLADTVRDAETTLRERQSRREDHERQRTTPNPADEVRAEQTRIGQEWEQAKQRVTESEFILRQDNERSARTAALRASIAKQEAINGRWNQLDGLIGSSDGKKFRNYAQQFTLEVLLGYANRHLSDLSRRYRLERVKDTLALLVVDQDMGDEPRSVHSLSGGESFLVSLALALGLASLSSNRVRVESLFIDEGFGSLDGDTLRIAMDALDKLQAQGRKVGVISHVQDMTERIGVQIQVRRQSGGKSRVEVRSV